MIVPDVRSATPARCRSATLARSLSGNTKLANRSPRPPGEGRLSSSKNQHPPQAERQSLSNLEIRDFVDQLLKTSWAYQRTLLDRPQEIGKARIETQERVMKLR